ncbi:MAG TPA: hypothetical protein V6D15_21265 [Oculatellaceae cyanobacterium]
MNRVFGWLQTMQLRQAITACFLGLILFVSAAFGQFTTPQAFAATTTPEASSYQVPQQDKQTGGSNPLQNAAETVKEKLNLDEPLPTSTKKFIKQVQGEDVQVNEPRPSGKGKEAME